MVAGVGEWNGWGDEMGRFGEGPYAPRCRCGHDKSSPFVLPVRRYSVWGMMCLLMGYTARPARVEIACATCGTILDTITNRVTLERFRYDEPRPSDK